jgi:hypothetical protein
MAAQLRALDRSTLWFVGFDLFGRGKILREHDGDEIYSA